MKWPWRKAEISVPNATEYLDKVSALDHLSRALTYIKRLPDNEKAKELLMQTYSATCDAMWPLGDFAPEFTAQGIEARRKVGSDSMTDKTASAVPASRSGIPNAAGFEVMLPNEEGWSDWIHPLPGYQMKCCDCGLVHLMEVAIGETETNGGARNDGETEDRVVLFRMRRADS